MEKKKLWLVVLICLSVIAMASLLLVVFLPKKLTQDNHKFNISYSVGDAVNSSIYESKQVDNGYILQEPETTPKSVNKYFEDWYLDSDYLTKVTFPLTITKDTIIYAKYIDGNVPQENIFYDSSEITYYVSGQIDIDSETLVVPDVYNDGIHGIKSITYILSDKDNGILTNNTTVKKIIVGNSIEEIGEYFVYNNKNITDVVIGRNVNSISGTAFGNCINLNNINIDTTQWQIADSGSSGGVTGWYEDLGLNVSTIKTSLNITWKKLSENYTITFKVGIIPELSTDWTDETEVINFNNEPTNLYDVENRYNSTIDNYNETNYSLIFSWNDDFSITCKVHKQINDFNPYTIPMPYGNNTYFEGWYKLDGSNYILIAEDETISPSVFDKSNLYAKYLKGNIDTSTLEYNETTNTWKIASSNADYVTNNNITDLVIPDYYYDGTNSGLITDIYDGSYNGTSGFIEGTNIKNFKIGRNIRRISAYAFRQCTNLANVILPNSVTSIGSNAFDGCNNLINITISDIITNIEAGAFQDCSNLSSITIPEMVTSIGMSAFFGCSGLMSLIIPSSVTSIGDSAFNGCSGLTNVTIKTGVKSIGVYTFSGCSGLTEIKIPASVTSMRGNAFTNCNGLTKIEVDSGNSKYTSTDISGKACNAIIDKNSNVLIAGCKETKVPDSVTSIGDEAFRNCSSLTSITIPSSVTSIGYSAFLYCSGLTSITIPNSVTSIDSYAFYDCSGLTSITIPNSVTSIGSYAFQYCSGLTSIKVDSGNTKYDSRNNCNALIETSTNTLITGCKNTVIPTSVTSIGTGAFYNCSGLTSITIPNSVTSIGSYAFQYCSGLTSIIIPSNVTSIGNSAFYNCSKLTSVTFENTTGWWVSTSSTATSGTSVTISATDLSANATLLKTTHVSKYWKRS